MTTTPHTFTHLLVGGTGKTGRRVRDRLQQRGERVRSLSRPAFDWSSPQTWSSVAGGADAVYLTVAPDVAFPGAPEAALEVTRRVLDAGARRVVLLSGRGEPEAQRAEQMFAGLVADREADWAVVRCAFFMQNFSEGFLADALAAGELAFPADAVREPFVDTEDIADVVTGLLLGDVPAGRVYELTGPRLLSFGEATAIIGEAAGRHLTYTPVTVEAFVGELVGAGLPEPDAVGLGDLFAHVLDGHNEHLSDGVQQALGRPARSFEDYARRSADASAWATTRV